MKRKYKTVRNGDGTRLEIGPGECLLVGAGGKRVKVKADGIALVFPSWKDMVLAIDVSQSFYYRSDQPNREKVGECIIDPNGMILTFRRQYHRQGWIFKDYHAFYHEPKKPCYVPELSVEVYTREDFLRLCKGQEEIAEKVFEAVDWQQPETYLDELYREGGMAVCRFRGNIFMCHDVDKCPCCGAESRKI